LRFEKVNEWVSFLCDTGEMVCEDAPAKQHLA
jgi:hypothetical protein